MRIADSIVLRSESLPSVDVTELLIVGIPLFQTNWVGIANAGEAPRPAGLACAADIVGVILRQFTAEGHIRRDFAG